MTYKKPYDPSLDFKDLLNFSVYDFNNILSKDLGTLIEWVNEELNIQKKLLKKKPHFFKDVGRKMTV